MSSTRYALLSVFNKRGIVEFAQALEKTGYKVISTGGTAKALADAGVKVIPVQEITGNPESFDGRMKTISFQIESGILFDRRNKKHVEEARKLKIKPIDVVVCNLYPFEETIAKTSNLDIAVENIDVGGPTMIRSAAKNFKNVIVVVDPSDYGFVSKFLTKGDVSDSVRKNLAAKAFSHLSFYDSQIAQFLNNKKFPKEITIPGRFSKKLRYGENPHQEAAVYLEPNTNSPIGSFQKVIGRELSYVNLTDISAGIESVRLFNEPCAVVIKHNSPSGIALGETAALALERAVEADPESAFGGVIVLTTPIDERAAETFATFKEEHGVLVDIIAAPKVSDGAKEIITNTRKSTGIYTFGKIPGKRSERRHMRFFDGGFVIQDWDSDVNKSFSNWKAVGKYKPSKKQMEQMKIAWKFIRRIRSNSVIVVDRDLPMTRGIGSGQTSRVRATKIALEQAGKFARSAVLASDSFFPFSDSVKQAVEKGIGAIIEQGGSVRDRESIDEANRAKIPIVFTGERVFWH